MGRNPAWLSPKQIGVLRWVEGGCATEDDDPGYERRITAHALARRGLITITGHGASWSAAITASGRARLATHPDQVPTEAEVAALVRQVQADGRVALAEDDVVESAHKQLVKLSERSPSRPRGWRLEMRGAGRWGGRPKEIVLVPYFDERVDEMPVPVPAQVPGYHPTVKAFIADRGRHELSRGLLPRASRLLQVIVDEAPRRGFRLVEHTRAMIGVDSYRSREIDRAHLVLASPVGTYSVRVFEPSTRRAAPLEPPRSSRGNTGGGRPAPRTAEFIVSGLLELVVEGPGTAYGGDRYRDTKTISVEAKLPRLFRDLEIHRLEVEQREQERQWEAADRQSRWEVAMIEARRQYDEQARWDGFQRRSSEWHSITRHRTFLAAARKAVGDYSGPGREDLLTQLAFAERRLEAGDPIVHPRLLMPEVSDPKPEDLKPFLDGWSPHGPGN